MYKCVCGNWHGVMTIKIITILVAVNAATAVVVVAVLTVILHFEALLSFLFSRSFRRFI